MTRKTEKQTKSHNYYLAHRDEILKRVRKYYKTHKKQIKEYKRDYEARNKRRLKVKHRRYYRKNREAILARAKEQRLANPELFATRNKKYCEEHKEAIRVKQHKNYIKRKRLQRQNEQLRHKIADVNSQLTALQERDNLLQRINDILPDNTKPPTIKPRYMGGIM